MKKYIGALALAIFYFGSIVLLAVHPLKAHGCTASVTHIQTITVSHKGHKKIESLRQQIIEAKQGVCK